MLEKGKISSFQMAVMLFPTVLATGLLAQSASAAQYAANDYWMTGIVAAAAGFMTIFVMTQLQKRFPTMNFIEYIELILGKWLGRLIGMGYFLYLLTISGGLVRQYADFVSGSFLFRTPTLFITAGLVLLAAFAVRGGIEVLARSSVIIFPIFVLPLFILLLLIPDMDASNMLPVLSRGIVPVLKGSAAPQGWVCEFFMIAFLMPYVVDQDKGVKWSSLSMVAVILCMTFVNLATLFVFGLDTGDKSYPMLVAYRYISVFNFFENLESLMLAMWVAGNFIKLGVFYYAIALACGQCFRLTDYRPVVFPLGILIVIVSIWGIPDYSAFAVHLRTSVPFELTVFFLIIPLLLLIVAMVRRLKATGEGQA